MRCAAERVLATSFPRSCASKSSACPRQAGSARPRRPCGGATPSPERTGWPLMRNSRAGYLPKGQGGKAASGLLRGAAGVPPLRDRIRPPGRRGAWPARLFVVFRPLKNAFWLYFCNTERTASDQKDTLSRPERPPGASCGLAGQAERPAPRPGAPHEPRRQCDPPHRTRA